MKHSQSQDKSINQLNALIGNPFHTNKWQKNRLRTIEVRLRLGKILLSKHRKFINTIYEKVLGNKSSK